MMLKGAPLRLKSPASRLFAQPFIEGADQRKHQSSASLAFVRGIHRWPVNSPHKGSITRKIFPFDEVIIHDQGVDWDLSLLLVAAYTKQGYKELVYDVN